MTDNDIDLVIFDCDGVLVDSEMISAAVLVDELSRLGIVMDVEQATWRFLGRSFSAIVASLERDYPVRLPDGFEAQYRTRLLEAFERQLRPTPGIDRLLPGLAVRACVATSSAVPRATRALELTGLEGFFTNGLFTASEVPHGKPAPDLFLHAAARMGAPPPRCLVIEDSVPGIEAAQRAGMQSLVYAGGAHMRGSNAPTATLAGSLGRVDTWAAFRDRYPMLLR